MAHRLGLDASRCIAIDTLFPFGWKQCSVRSIMGTITSTRKTLAMASKLFSSDGASVALLGDSPGFIAQRVIGMIVSIACDMAQQDGCFAQGYRRRCTHWAWLPGRPYEHG